MKDRHDKGTGNLLASPTARRQARFREGQAKLGRKQKIFWVTEGEAEKLKDYLETLRGDAPTEHAEQ